MSYTSKFYSLFYTQYGGYSTIVYMVKMESVSEMIGLKLESGLELFFEIPPCKKKVIFVNEFVVLGKNLPFL